MAQIDESSNGGIVRLTVAGELDLSSAPELAADLLDALDHSPLVEVDLSAVTFIDSSGLRALLGGLTDGHPDHRMAIVAVSPQVRSLLNLTGLAEEFGLGESPVASV